MEIIELGSEHEITEFSSRGAHWVPVITSDGECHVGRMRLEPGAVLGMHPTKVDQLFMVIEGSGWVRVPGEDRVPIAAGQAVMWQAGEAHESGTDQSMTALIVQAESLKVARS